ncbi:MAG: hypothetical protein PHD67_05945, partial [Oscillospiraceae bacterium]|nr:hypothetical protein [Oscillospiraceae bacterium]
MDIGSALGDRALDDGVDQPDGRRGLAVVDDNAGGGDILLTELSYALSPDIQLVNGEELFLSITPGSDGDCVYTVTIENGSGRRVYTLEDITSADVLNNENITGDPLSGSFRIVLDSLSEGLHFKNLYPASDGFVPGGNVTVTVSSAPKSGGKEPASVAASANS